MKNRKYSGRTEVILDLIKGGFFNEHRSTMEIKSQLVRIGRKGLCCNLEETLLRLVRQNKLNRLQLERDGKSVWCYRKPKEVSVEDETEFIFDRESRYDFYTEIKRLISIAKREIMIIDSYINEDIFELYMTKVNPGVDIKILTNPATPKGSFKKVAHTFKSQHSSFQVRESLDCHDRILFIDSDAWIFGQSIKSAGNKPTYLIKIKKSKKLRNIFNRVWDNSKKII